MARPDDNAAKSAKLEGCINRQLNVIVGDVAENIQESRLGPEERVQAMGWTAPTDHCRDRFRRTPAGWRPGTPMIGAGLALSCRSKHHRFGASHGIRGPIPGPVICLLFKGVLRN